MKFGLSQTQFAVLENLVLNPLKNEGAEVFVFGSRARNTHHPFSDIDLLYKEAPTKPIALSKIAKIMEEIENSNLTIKVDLVNNASLAASYRESVERDMIRI